MIPTATKSYNERNAKKYEELILSNTADSYHEFVAKNGVSTDTILRDTEAAAGIARLHSDTNHGAQAEALSTRGLSDSGYEDYLRRAEYDKYRSALSAAREASALGEYTNAFGYEKYLSDYEAMQDKISKSFIEDFAKGRSFDVEAAYRSAIEAGLNDERAFFTATQAVAAAKDNTYNMVITFAKANGLSAKKAKEYAATVGLDERYQERVYDAISVFTEEEKAYYSSMTPEQYYDYIISISR